MRTRRANIALAGAVTLLAAVTLVGQEQRFETQSRLVQIPVNVTDGKGRPVDGLEAADFLVLDNGEPRKVVVDTFNTGLAPIALVVAVQSSGISAAVLAKVQDVGAMIQPLITGAYGCAALVSFDERVEWLQDCTEDPYKLSDAFYRLRPGAERDAHMLDAAYEAVERLLLRPNSRRVLLLISESRDRGSETSLEKLLFAAQASGVTIYTATYSAFATALTAKRSRPARLPEEQPEATKPPKQPPPAGRTPVPTPTPQRVDLLAGMGELLRLGKTNATKALAEATGGTVFEFTRQKGLEDALQELGGELNTQYVLSFVPESPVPGYHELEVRVKDGDKCEIRARPGYWAAGSTGGQ
jgi:VWFA-related protein